MVMLLLLFIKHELIRIGEGEMTEFHVDLDERGWVFSNGNEVQESFILNNKEIQTGNWIEVPTGTYTINNTNQRSISIMVWKIPASRCSGGVIGFSASKELKGLLQTSSLDSEICFLSLQQLPPVHLSVKTYTYGTNGTLVVNGEHTKKSWFDAEFNELPWFSFTPSSATDFEVSVSYRADRLWHTSPLCFFSEVSHSLKNGVLDSYCIDSENIINELFIKVSVIVISFVFTILLPVMLIGCAITRDEKDLISDGGYAVFTSSPIEVQQYDPKNSALSAPSPDNS